MGGRTCLEYVGCQADSVNHPVSLARRGPPVTARTRSPRAAPIVMSTESLALSAVERVEWVETSLIIWERIEKRTENS